MSTLGRTPWNKGKTKKDSPGLARVAKAKAKWWSTGRHASTRKKIGAKSKGRIKGGAAHPSWKGGRYSTKRDKYVYVYAPDHPNAVGRHLHHDEDVNHINGIKNDNRPENLRLVSHYAHFEEHGCPKCGFHFFTK